MQLGVNLALRINFWMYTFLQITVFGNTTTPFNFSFTSPHNTGFSITTCIFSESEKLLHLMPPEAANSPFASLGLLFYSSHDQARFYVLVNILLIWWNAEGLEVHSYLHQVYSHSATIKCFLYYLGRLTTIQCAYLLNW